MNGGKVRGPGRSALESVRRLEQTLESKTGMRRIAEARQAAAREEATRLLRAAQETGASAAAERRRAVLAETGEEVARILRLAWDEVDRLRAVAEEDRTVAARAAVERILPAGVKAEET